MLEKLKSLFGSKPKPTPVAGPQLAMPLFDSVQPIEPADVVEQWTRLFPKQGVLRVEARNEDVVEFAAGGRSLMAAHMPAPVPLDEALGAVRASWMWQRPEAPVRAHRAHAIVTATGSGDPVHAAWDVARLSAAVLNAGSGVALYWGSARQMHPPEIVADFAGEELPPVPLWVGITISGESEAGPFSAATHGLASLGHKEFEVLATRTGIGDLRSTLYDMALYVLRNGPVLGHGHTFGPSEDVVWKVRHVASELVPGRDVILLGIP